MKNMLFLVSVLTSITCISQITLIPDEEFEMFLVLNAIDTDGTVNGQVATTDIESLTELNIDQVPIADLTGIEDFAALENLNIEFTNLTSLDVSQNQNLIVLNCQDNKLTQLALGNNPNLETVFCGNPTFDAGGMNQFTTLDLSGVPNLKFLNTEIVTGLTTINLSENILLEDLNARYCDLSTINLSNNIALKNLSLGGQEGGIIFGVSNNLSEIDLSNNPNLESVRVQLTGISRLNLQNGTNPSLINVDAFLNPDLNCIQVDDAIAATNGSSPYGNWNVDPQVTYSEDCVLGVAKNKLSDVVLYPNPASGSLHLSSTTSQVPSSIHIYSTSGKLLIEETTATTTIAISELASGFYFIKAQYENGIFTSSFIKK